MGRKSATKIANIIETVKQDLANTEIDLNAPAVDPDAIIVSEPRVLPDLTVDEKTGMPKDDKVVDTGIRLSFEDLDKAGCKNKSDSIRYLASLGYKKSPIAKFLGVRYQHVNNVLNKELKRKVLPWVAGAEPQVDEDVTGDAEADGE